MTQWTESSPGAGDPQQVRDFAKEQSSRASLLSSAMWTIADINEAVARETTSQSSAAWSSRLADLHPRLSDAREWFRDRAAAAKTYAGAIESIKDRADSLKRQINGKRTTRAYLQAYADPHTPADALASRLLQIDAQTRDLERSLSRLCDERTDADQAFNSVLNTSLDIPGATSWTAAIQLFGPDALDGNYAHFRDTTNEILERMAERIGRIPEEGLDEEELEELSKFFDALSGDPNAASKFWTDVGGENTRELFWFLGDDPFFGDEPASWSLKAAQAARGSLSAGSTEWTRPEAQQFVSGLFEKEGSEFGPVSPHTVVSYLFAVPDHAPMGEALTLAMADRFDADERADGPPIFGALEHPLWNEASRIPGGDTGPNPGARDAMSQVLRTLSLYPESSLDWLTQTGIAGAADPISRRGQYWIGERLWADDGLTGIAAAIESAMTVRGGIDGGPVYMDTEVWQDQAFLIMDVIEGLGAAPASHFSPELVAPQASVSLAGTLDRALPWLVETSIGSDAVKPQKSYGLGTAQLFGTGDRLDAPVIADRALTTVWGTVASTPEGRLVLAESVRDYQDTMISNAIYGEQTGVPWSAALDRVAKLEGFHQGSSGGVERYLASLDDAFRQKGLDLASTVASGTPIPFADQIPRGTLALLEFGKGISTHVGSDYIESILINAEETAVAEIKTDFHVKGAGFDMFLQDLFDNPPPGIEEQFMRQDLEGILGDRADLFDMAYKESLVNTNDRELYGDFDSAPK